MPIRRKVLIRGTDIAASEHLKNTHCFVQSKSYREKENYDYNQNGSVLNPITLITGFKRI